jgi:hypothetical protein
MINNKYQDNRTPGSINHNMKVMTQDLSRGSRACQHASPRCVPLYHVVRWLIGHTPSLSKGATRTYQMARGCNDTSNLLTFPLALRRGRHKPLTILPTPPSCSKPSRWRQPPRETRIPQQINHQVPTRCNLTM